MSKPVATGLDLEQIRERNDLRIAACNALAAYRARQSLDLLHTATEAVAAYRGRYGPLEWGGFMWTLSDGTDEIIKFPARAKR